MDATYHPAVRSADECLRDAATALNNGKQHARAVQHNLRSLAALIGWPVVSVIRDGVEAVEDQLVDAYLEMQLEHHAEQAQKQAAIGAFAEERERHLVTIRLLNGAVNDAKRRLRPGRTLPEWAVEAERVLPDHRRAQGLVLPGVVGADPVEAPF